MLLCSLEDDPCGQYEGHEHECAEYCEEWAQWHAEQRAGWRHYTDEEWAQWHASVVTHSLVDLLGSLSSDQLALVIAKLVAALWYSNQQVCDCLLKSIFKARQASYVVGESDWFGLVSSDWSSRGTTSMSQSEVRPFLQPEKLPPTCPETNEPVAFQTQIGTPWRCFGSQHIFTWDSAPRAVVPQDAIDRAKLLLAHYAECNGIKLVGDSSVKLALWLSCYGCWVSYAGGISW